MRNKFFIVVNKSYYGKLAYYGYSYGQFYFLFLFKCLKMQTWSFYYGLSCSLCLEIISNINHKLPSQPRVIWANQANTSTDKAQFRPAQLNACDTH